MRSRSHPVPSWRGITALAALAVLLAAGGPATANEPAEERQARVGEILLLKLPGNRDAGYRWYFNGARSRGAELVEVEQVAWNKYDSGGRSIFFSEPAVLTISVLPKATGQADLAFDYVRTWGRKPHIKTHMVRVTIAGAD